MTKTSIMRLNKDFELNEVKCHGCSKMFAEHERITIVTDKHNKDYVELWHPKCYSR